MSTSLSIPKKKSKAKKLKTDGNANSTAGRTLHERVKLVHDYVSGNCGILKQGYGSSALGTARALGNVLHTFSHVKHVSFFILPVSRLSQSGLL